MEARHQRGENLSLPEIAYIDKFAHSLIYGVLASTAVLAVPAAKRGDSKGLFGVSVVLFCLLYGISDEYHQSFIPGRFPSMGDLVADVAGAAAAVCLWSLWAGQGATPSSLSVPVE